MTASTEPDPYRLSLPAPDTAVVSEPWVKAVHAHLNSKYSDIVWLLAPLSDNPAQYRPKVHWSTCPEPFQDDLRLAAWNMINGELRPSFAESHDWRTRSRVSMAVVISTVRIWFRLAKWLQQEGVTSLRGCDQPTLAAYAHYYQDTATGVRSTQKTVLMAITRLWAVDQISAQPNGVGRPPWDVEGMEDYLPHADRSGGENATEALHENTIGPLLVWSMRMVDDLSDDILTARAEYQRIRHSVPTAPEPAGKHAIRRYLNGLLHSDAPLPARVVNGRVRLAETYICGCVGATKAQFRDWLHAEALIDTASRRELACPLPFTPTGVVNDKPWRQVIDYDEVHQLRRHLGTAAYIVCAYLTGMRPGEVLGLRTGCCPDPEGDKDSATRHFIYGNAYKTAVDEDGIHRCEGVQREIPWVAIAPVVRAIRVLERMVPDGSLLFDSTAHDRNNRTSQTGAICHNPMVVRMNDFAQWVNKEADLLDMPRETIPADPDGRITLARFRRTLAWHIAYRPNGHVALAIQYGHMRLAVSGGYASRGRQGIDGLVDVETVRATSDVAADLQESLSNGGGVSGPAAREVIKMAPRVAAFAGTTITPKTARRLIANNELMIYDNPNALLLCRFKPDRALCRQDPAINAPTLHACRPGCANIARTDRHASELRARADTVERQADHTPTPIGDRLRNHAALLRARADAHDQTRIVPAQTSDDETPGDDDE